MPEHIILADDNIVDLTAAELLLRSAEWPSIHLVRSAAELSSLVGQLVGPIVLISDLEILRAAADVIDVIRLRRSSIIGSTRSFPTPLPSMLDRVIRKPYGDDLKLVVVDEVARLRLQAQMRFAVALLIADRSNPKPSDVRNNGTGCLVELPRRRIVLTAAHVARSLYGNGAVGLLGGHGARPIEIGGWPVLGIDDIVDIASIAVPDTFEPSTIGKEFYRPPAWPPSRAIRGAVATFAGYAGIHRVPETDRMTLHASTITDFVSSVSARHFIVADENRERSMTAYQRDLADFGPTGGMSGAPVFAGGEELATELRGVLHEGGDGTDATFFVAHSDFIRPDGTLDEDLPR